MRLAQLSRRPYGERVETKTPHAYRTCASCRVPKPQNAFRPTRHGGRSIVCAPCTTIAGRKHLRKRQAHDGRVEVLCGGCGEWHGAAMHIHRGAVMVSCSECRAAARLAAEVRRERQRSRPSHDPEPRTLAEHKERCASRDAQRQRDYDALAANTREVLGR